MIKIFFIATMFLAVQVFAVSVPIPREASGKLKDLTWNGTVPLSLPKKLGENIRVFLVLTNKEREFSFLYNTNGDTEEITFSLYPPADPSGKAYLKIIDNRKSWPFKTIQAKITWDTNPPVLELISTSPSITRGGAAVAVLRSEPLSNLIMLAFVDRDGIPYYPQTFKKDGFYALIFPWYLNQGAKWSDFYFIAVDKAGNSNILYPNITGKNKTFVQKKIMLKPDYGKEKAKELGLSAEEAKKLETNILAINTALGSTRSFDRWKLTRKSFSESVKRVVSGSGSVFSQYSAPFKNYVVTANYGDRRRYFFQNKQVRESTHLGKDMAGVKNSPVYSILDGTVIYADWNKGNGKNVVIDHGMDIYSFYAHNEEFKVKEGDIVKAGQQIAVSGTTGQSTGDHLHLSIIVQGMYIDPQEWMSYSNIEKQFIQPLIEAENIIEGKAF